MKSVLNRISSKMKKLSIVSLEICVMLVISRKYQLKLMNIIRKL